MWEIDIEYQMLGLICSLPLGIITAFLYDVLRAFNKCFQPKAVTVFVIDFLYWLVLTVVYFMFFMVFSNGQIRLYVFFGAVAGFIFSRLTLSKIFVFIFLLGFRFLKLLSSKLRRFFISFKGLVAKKTKNLVKMLKKPFIKRKNA